jgi:cytochrome c556
MICKRSQMALTAVLLAAIALGINLTGTHHAAASPDLAKVIQDRRQFMKGNAQQMVTINNFLEKGQGTSGDVVNAAELLAANSKKIVDMFPKGTGIDDGVAQTHAEMAIWGDLAGFKSAADNMGALALELADAAKSGDKAAMSAEFQHLAKEGCGGCHIKFRAPLQ